MTIQLQSTNYLSHSAYNIPKPEKAYKGGEDGFFQSNNVIAVADGVSSWDLVGIDPGLYSKKLTSP
jgi:hypothetical protein